VVDHGHVLVEAVADGALADDRRARVLVHVAARRDEEELRAEVSGLVGREHLQRLTVRAQRPAGEEPRIAVKEAVRLVG
jgi:hypothetical protein